jgi:hypothetical protein
MPPLRRRERGGKDKRRKESAPGRSIREVRTEEGSYLQWMVGFWLQMEALAALVLRTRRKTEGAMCKLSAQPSQKKLNLINLFCDSSNKSLK